jgi:hypothetical protein
MRLLDYSTVTAVLLFTTACSSGQPPEATPPAPPAKTVFDPLTQQLDRARDVQNTVDANTEATRKAVDEQERGDHAP